MSELNLVLELRRPADQSWKAGACAAQRRDEGKLADHRRRRPSMAASYPKIRSDHFQRRFASTRASYAEAHLTASALPAKPRASAAPLIMDKVAFFEELARPWEELGL